MSELDDIQAKLLNIQLIRDIENTFDVMDKAVANQAFVTKVEATDTAEAERSAVISLTPDETAQLYAQLKTIVAPRLAQLKTSVGM